MIGSGGGLFAAYLDAHGRTRHLFPSPMPSSPVRVPPMGVAERVAGGYRVTGRWRYASGADYATTFTANCRIIDRGTPLSGLMAQPLIRAMAFDASQVR